MSLHKFAEQVAANGRGDDSLLVHMTPDEVQRLQAFAEANGRTMTINPETGLPEAGFLSDLFKAVAPIALGAFLGPAGAAIGGGFMSAGMAGLAVGGITTLATGSLSRGLMAGLGAYGGAGLGESLMNAGTGALSQSAGAGLVGDEAIQQAVGAKLAAATPMETLTAGFNSATATPSAMGAFAKQNLGNIGYAASPILAGAMVPTTTKADTTKSDNYIRQFDFNINPETGKPDPLYGVRSMAPVKANEFGNKTFQGQRDLFRQQNPNPYDIGVASLNQPPQQQMGMAGGGIVALARGGMQHYEDGGGVTSYEDNFLQSQADAQAAGTTPNYDKVIADAYATIGRSGVGEGTSQIDQGGYNHFLNMLQTGQVAPDSFNDVFQGAVTRYIADNPNDRYTQYVNEYRGNAADTGGGGVTNLATTGGGAATAADTSGIATLNNTGAATSAAGTNLNAFSNAYTGANINDYIANNKLDAAGIQTAATQFNVDPAQITAAQNAQNIVTNVYRNVLGRDPDPAGLSWWTNQIMNGDRTGAEMYESFKQSAKQTLGAEGTKEIFKDLSLADATKDSSSTVYQSADKRTIADEWVRNTLGREVTDADRKTQWYKDASDSTKMKTVNIAEDIYGKFKNFARDDAGDTAAKKITEAKTLLTSKGLSEMDVLRQTGKTIAELVGSGLKLENDLFKASQLLKPGEKAGFDFNTITKPVVKPIVNDFSNTVTPGGFYGNNTGNPLTTTPGDITQNADGTVTVQPNIPGRPTGGFTGIQQIKDAYTAGGGSLGFTSRVPKSIDEFNQMYNKQTGDSLAAYNYLMGKGANPVKSGVPKLAVPYDEFALGKKTSALKPPTVTGDTLVSGGVSYDLTDPTNPPPADTKGTWQWNVLNKRWIKIAANGAVVSDGGGSGGVGGESGGPNGGGGGNLGGGGGDLGGEGGGFAMAAAGGMMGYAVGGGLGSLGSYSDGGRLLKGPGDGVSDSIPATIGRKQQPARLADGEFVIPARIVSELGNGSTDAGAKKLYAMMDRVQKARGKTTGKNKVAANSRSDKYLPA